MLANTLLEVALHPWHVGGIQELKPCETKCQQRLMQKTTGGIMSPKTAEEQAEQMYLYQIKVMLLASKEREKRTMMLTKLQKIRETTLDSCCQKVAMSLQCFQTEAANKTTVRMKMMQRELKQEQ